MKKQLKYILPLGLAAFAYGCGGAGGGPTDTPTTGTIHITVDESYEPMMKAEIDMFEALYVKAKINASYTSEAKAFEDLLADSSRLIVVNRDLNEQEKDYFKKLELTPKTIHIANDGLAFIVNNENPVSKMLYGSVKDIFAGGTNTWKQIMPTLGNDSLRVIFDNPGGGNVRMIQEKFGLKGDLPSHCFSVNSNAEVVKYVETHPNAMGIISVNWISDSSDSTAIEFLKKVKVLQMSPEGVTDTSGVFYGPYQGYIANESYPFIRKTYIITREARSGLGTGFASFVSSDKGQRIILRSGMVPAVAPVRIVNVNMEQ